MAGSAAVLTNDSLLSHLDRKLLRLERFMALLAGLSVFGLMVLAVVSVTGRNGFNQPLPGYVDWIQQLMPLIAFMGISFVQRDGGHIRMDILVSRLSGRALWLFEFITTALVLLLMVMLVWGTWAHFDRSFDMTKPMWSRDSTIDIGLPIWPAKLLAPVAFFVLCLRCSIQLIGYGKAIVTGTDSPVAVPLIQSAAEQAAAEAEHIEGRD
ncbi:TRAP transporter small permease subunit [Donghicola tyrosinivorans]|uniref:TRAP transporter small permease protein n=1 Tax=Donghicola tyrosinivorans TaxID=1652492 RepID=A0A2T0WF85_9RHOB|nr:TRAP transporter small permease [Donghicola tyrosinivorans]PRY85370.1 TRAP-type mannitol/chloroaromatic compound transport system permease small subunit [Donghicola tyrosinivorans]